MRSKRIILFLIILLSVVNPVHAFEDAIIAIVNDEIVTLKDYRNFLNAAAQQMALEGFPREQIQGYLKQLEEEGLNRLIEEKLIIAEGLEIGMEIKEEAVDREMEKIKERYPSEQAFLDALVLDGNNVTDLRNKLREKLITRYVIQLEVKNKIAVNPQEITEYYEKNPQQFQRPERVNLDSIFIPFGNNKEESIKTANTIRKRLDEGEDFKALAEEFSKGPAIGVIEKGQMMNEIEDPVFALNVNEVSAPVETDTGLFIFKIIAKIQSDTIPINEVRKNINNLIFQQKYKEKYSAWIEKLKDKAYVEIKE